ncbi:hypothetical protein MKX03_002250 [Papaver bracteatum]|nr:hypothetical protein MKX03_002250 [Papaver bracteatum]
MVSPFSETLNTLFVIHYQLTKLKNKDGQNMDFCIPKKCSAAIRIITAKDQDFVQLNIGHIDESGIYTGQFCTFSLWFRMFSGNATSNCRMPCCSKAWWGAPIQRLW